MKLNNEEKTIIQNLLENEIIWIYEKSGLMGKELDKEMKKYYKMIEKIQNS